MIKAAESVIITISVILNNPFSTTPDYFILIYPTSGVRPGGKGNQRESAKKIPGWNSSKPRKKNSGSEPGRPILQKFNLVELY
jgi:hypothetical protein